MVASLPLPSFKEVQEYYNYTPDTGELILIKARCNADSKKLNKPIGSLGGPRRRRTWVVKHKGKSYYVSRIAWLLMTKEDPGDLQVEHINRNPQDNSWNNLRLATPTQNNYNKVSIGYTKRKDSGLYRVRVTVDKTRITVGNFKTEEEAKVAISSARRFFYGEYICIDLK